VVSGRVSQGVSLEVAEREIDNMLQQIIREGVTQAELEKARNQAESLMAFEEVDVMNRAMNLAFASLSGDPNLVNEEPAIIQSITKEDIQRVAGEIFREDNASVLYYKASK